MREALDVPVQLANVEGVQFETLDNVPVQVAAPGGSGELQWGRHFKQFY